MHTSIERRLAALEQHPQPDTARCVQVVWECAARDWALLYAQADVSDEVCAELLTRYGLADLTPADRVYLLVTVCPDAKPVQPCEQRVVTDARWCASFPPAGEPNGIITYCGVAPVETPYLFWHLRG